MSAKSIPDSFELKSNRERHSYIKSVTVLPCDSGNSKIFFFPIGGGHPKPSLTFDRTTSADRLEYVLSASATRVELDTSGLYYNAMVYLLKSDFQKMYREVSKM